MMANTRTTINEITLSPYQNDPALKARLEHFSTEERLKEIYQGTNLDWDNCRLRLYLGYLGIELKTILDVGEEGRVAGLDFDIDPNKWWGINGRIWTIGQCLFQITPGLYFYCVTEATDFSWLPSPEIFKGIALFSTPVTNYLLHIAFGAFATEFLKRLYLRYRSALRLKENGDASSATEQRIIAALCAMTTAIAVAGVGPYAAVGDEMESACPFNLNTPFMDFTFYTGFTWLNLPASFWLAQKAFSPFNSLFEHLATALGMQNDLVKWASLYNFWQRKALSNLEGHPDVISLDDLRYVVSSVINEAHWMREKRDRSEDQTSSELRNRVRPNRIPLSEALVENTERSEKLETYLRDLEGHIAFLKRDGWFSANQQENQETLLKTYLKIYLEQRDYIKETHGNLPSSDHSNWWVSAQKIFWFLLCWTSFSPFFISTAGDEEFPAIQKLTSILVCSILCIDTGNGFYNFVKEVIPSSKWLTHAGAFFSVLGRHFSQLITEASQEAEQLVQAPGLSSFSDDVKKLAKDRWRKAEAQKTAGIYFSNYKIFNYWVAADIFSIGFAIFSAGATLETTQKNMLENTPENSATFAGVMAFMLISTAVFNVLGLLFVCLKLVDSWYKYGFNKAASFDETTNQQRHAVDIMMLEQVCRQLGYKLPEEQFAIFHSLQSLRVDVEAVPQAVVNNQDEEEEDQFVGIESSDSVDSNVLRKAVENQRNSVSVSLVEEPSVVNQPTVLPAVYTLPPKSVAEWQMVSSGIQLGLSVGFLAGLDALLGKSGAASFSIAFATQLATRFASDYAMTKNWQESLANLKGILKEAVFSTGAGVLVTYVVLSYIMGYYSTESFDLSQLAQSNDIVNTSTAVFTGLVTAAITGPGFYSKPQVSRSVVIEDRNSTYQPPVINPMQGKNRTNSWGV